MFDVYDFSTLLTKRSLPNDGCQKGFAFSLNAPIQPFLSAITSFVAINKTANGTAAINTQSLVVNATVHNGTVKRSVDYSREGSAPVQLTARSGLAAKLARRFGLLRDE